MEQKRQPEIDPHPNNKLIFQKGVKANRWRKDSPFIKWCWNIWGKAKKINLDTNFTCFLKFATNF